MMADSSLAPASGTPAAIARSTKVLRTFVSEWGEELEEVACPVCHATDARPVVTSYDMLYRQPGTYNVVRCAACSLVYVNPRPTPSALGVHYPDDYFPYKAPENEPPFARKMAEASARDMARQRMLRLERAIGRLGADTQLIDVGCGLNYLLQAIKAERGAVGTGIDMKANMVARIRERQGMPAILGTLHEAKLPAGKLDLVTMIEYLEHEPDPPSMLAEARRVLKPGGHVAIEIPHYAGWPARVFKSRWANLDVPRHLVFFEPETLRRALAEQGLEMLSYQPFTMRFHFGINLLLALGARGIGRNPFAPLFATWLSLPFLPFQRWLPEFTLAVARAV